MNTENPQRLAAELSDKTRARGLEGPHRYDIRVEMVEKYRGVEYWTAYEDQRYDCDCDQDGFFPNYAQASGSSKWEAVRELIEQLEEHDG